MKRIILAWIFLCVILVSKAQVQFGVKAGVNVSNFKTSGINYFAGTNLSSKTDFNAGVVALLPVASDFFLQPELIYSRQGQRLTNPTLTVTYNYDYLNLPVLFKYQHVSGLFAETGPQIGFLLNAVEKRPGNTIDDNGIQFLDFSWAFGTGYKSKAFPIGLDLRYNLGLANLYKDSGAGTVKNSVFQFDVFYVFNRK